MSAEPVQTVNATIPQIQDALRAGRSVADIADEFAEPRATVYAIQRALATGPPDPRTLSNVADLVAAAEQSNLNRARTLGARIATAVADLRACLAEEFDRERAAAEVAMLERRLNEAKAKLRSGRRQPSTSSPRVSEARKAQMSALHQPADCRKCGRTCGSSAGRAAHERHCSAVA